MFSNLSAKNKTLLFVMFSLVLFSFILIVTIYINQKNELEEVEYEYYQNIKNSYEKILERHKSFYKYRLKNTINIKGVKELFYKNDREKLYELIKPQFNTLKEENKFLKIMHFHLPNGRSFLRVHKPDKYGDNIAKRRAMVRAMHIDKKNLNGFEAGIYMLAYREFIPIFYQDKYIGSVEFGSRPDQILEQMDYFSNIKGVLFIKKNKIIEYKESSDLSIQDYTLQYNGLDDTNLVNKLPKNYSFEENIEINYHEKTFMVYTFNLLDYNGNISAKAVFFHDITSIMHNFEETVKKLIILLIGLLGVLVLVINIGFEKIIQTIENINKKLSSSNKQVLALSDKYKKLMDFASDAIFILDQNGKLLEYSEVSRKMLGYTKDEMKRLSVEDWDISNSKDDILKQIKNISSEPISFETKHKRKDGTTYDAAITSVKIIIDDKEYVYASVRDITKQNIIENILQEQKKELETIFNTTKDGFAMVDLETNFLFFNDSYLEMTGFKAEELKTKSCAGLSISEDISKAQKVIAEVIEKGFVENFEKTCVVQGGKKVIVNMSLALMPDKQRILLSTRDVTEARANEAQFKEYIELVDKNIITSSTDLIGDITYVSDAFCNISGYTKEELMGKNHRIIRHPDLPNSFYKNMWDTVTADQIWEGEIKNRKKDGSHYWVKATIYPIYDIYGNKIGYTAIRQDITDKKIIEEISITDGLTNIYNRRYFNEMFPKLINGAKRHNELLCFLIMDIDHFKQYNDTYGHQMGDEVLISVAAMLKNSLHRADDYCFRLGGEEFGIIFKTDTKEKAFEFAQTIRKNIEDLKIEHKQSSTSKFVTASLGLVCNAANDIIDDDEIYSQADKMLYRSKESGRNKVSCD